MVATNPDGALEAERVRLEATLARLRTELGLVEGDLARAAKVGPPRTGFAWGLVVGVVLLLGLVLFWRSPGHAVSPIG